MSEDQNLPSPSEGDFLFYATEDGITQVRLLVDGQTVWMPQLAIAELFDTTKQNVSLHLQNIYDEEELSQEATVKEYLTVQIEGDRKVKRMLDHYNLDVILAIGYRIRSPRGTQFRRWATETLSEFLVKGFVLDDERLKAAESSFGQDYFQELLERIRDIRSSERRFYLKITDIYATSIDYDKNSDISRQFFATVQNKLAWAITDKTAAELIKDRADASQPNMGLKTWKNAPGGKIRKDDITVAKNYLNESELKDLNLIVTMYLDYAESQAKRNQKMTMTKWVEKLDGFLAFNDRAVLKNAGSIQRIVADELALEEFDKFKAIQRQLEATESNTDFENFIEETKKIKPPNPEDEE
ncbi:MAG: hydroxyacid dehydrogenase [Blastopirellula sp.]|nr:MAG: hydroxyacid dehydrogenase [Blastopirellula sp.]